MRIFIAAFIAGGVAVLVALAVGFVILQLFPMDAPAYVGIGLEPRNLPGSVLGLVIAILVYRKLRKSRTERQVEKLWQESERETEREYGPIGELGRALLHQMQLVPFLHTKRLLVRIP